MDVAAGPTGTTSRTIHRVKKTYTCPTCQRVFSRKEHCDRHERGHTREKPYRCRFCQRRYARGDLVSRHEKTLHAAERSAQQKQDGPAIIEPSQQLPPSPSTSSTRDGSTGHHPIESPNSLLAMDSPFDFTIPIGQIDDFSDHRHSIDTTSDSQARRDGVACQTDAYVSPSASMEDQELGHTSINSNHDTTLRQNSTNGTGSNITESPFGNIDFYALLTQEDEDLSPAQVPSDEPATMETTLPDEHSLPLTTSPGCAESYDFQYTNWQSPSDSGLRSPNGLFDPNAGAYEELHRDRSLETQSFTIDGRARDLLLTDMVTRLCGNSSTQIVLPPANILQRFLSSYLTCFHHHLPIIHIHTLNLDRTPAPLVLSMCAIGALYRLERKLAAHLLEWADRTLYPMSLEASTYRMPVWMLQSQLLSVFAKVFGGEPRAATAALETFGRLATRFRSYKANLPAKGHRSQSTTWHTWVEEETSKRVFCGIIALNSLIVVTYNMSPTILLSDTDLGLPSAEPLWEASSERQWRDTFHLLQPAKELSIKEAITSLIRAEELGLDGLALPSWCSFTITVVMHALFIHTWYMKQALMASAVVSVDSSADNALQSLVSNQMALALARCDSLFNRDSQEQEQHLDEMTASQRSNGLAMLRVAYVRANSDTSSLDRLSLLTCSNAGPNGTMPAPIRAFTEAQLRSYLQSKQHRSPSVTKAANKTSEGLFTSVRAGHLLVKKTATFKWSIDHAIADWDCALFLARWIHTLENAPLASPLSEYERTTLERLSSLLAEVDTDFVAGCTSLAAAITRLWAEFFDDTWVWRITLQQGCVLRMLADICEKERNTG